MLIHFMDRFKDRYGPWVIVTGASSGIGREFAYRLAERGLNIVLIARREDRLRSIASDLEGRYKVRVDVVPLDLSREDFMSDLGPSLKGKEVGLLVNNAGFATSGPFIRSDLDRELEMLYVNTRAPLILTRRIAPEMAGRGRGGIIFMASMAGMISLPYMPNYAATKSWDLFMGEALWFELREKGVDVISIAPGAVRTEFGKVAGLGSDFGVTSPGKVVRTALGRLGRTPSIVPGLGWKVLSSLARIPSRRVLTWIAGGLWGRIVAGGNYKACKERDPRDECL